MTDRLSAIIITRGTWPNHSYDTVNIHHILHINSNRSVLAFLFGN